MYKFFNANGTRYPLDASGRFVANGAMWQINPNGHGAQKVLMVEKPQFDIKAYQAACWQEFENWKNKKEKI